MDDFSAKKESIKKHHVAVQSGRQHQKTLVNWFENWRKFAWEEKDIRERSDKLKNAIAAKKGRNAL